MLDLTTSHVYYSKKETFVKMYDDFKDREGWYKPKQYAPDDYFLLAKKELTKIIEEYS